VPPPPMIMWTVPLLVSTTSVRESVTSPGCGESVRNQMRRFFQFSALAMSVALAPLMLALPTTALADDNANNNEPTIVLVHGAWAGPSSWDSVVRRLRDDGFRTVTPTLGLTSLPGDVATVSAVLNQIHGKKTLVAHSYGGAVISGASYGRSDVSALVYSAAFVPDADDSLLSLGTGFKPSGVIAHLVWTGAPFAPGSLALIDPVFFPQFFAQDLPAAQAVALDAAQRPIAFIPEFMTPSGPVGWHNIPSWYQVSGADRMIDPAAERLMASRAGAATVELPPASHVGGINLFSKQFAPLIEHAVEATAVNEQ
jgi:pimeloyl-ACP methyl ester carboxylesterase